MRKPAPLMPPLVTAAMGAACLASFIIGLALPLPSQRFALIDTRDGSPIAWGMTAQACQAMLAEYPQTAPRACR